MNGMLIKLEWKQMLRSRWMQLVGLLFTFVFTTIVVIQQMALPDVEGFTRQTASFLNVLFFLLPLFILTIGSMSVASDIESGWYSLLKTYPMTIVQFIQGKFVAIVSAFFLIAALAFGVVFSLSGLLGGVRLSLLFICLTALCIVIFTAVAIFIGTLAKTRLFALALSLVVWSFFLLLLSYALMAIGTVVAGHVLQKMTIVVMHINPVEWLRFGYFLFTDQASVLGPSFYSLTQFYTSVAGMVTYATVTVLWVGLPLIGARIVLRKRGRK
ncbi:MAG: ABC transporter permease subunit [Lysinibacillus sp.]